MTSKHHFMKRVMVFSDSSLNFLRDRPIQFFHLYFIMDPIGIFIKNNVKIEINQKLRQYDVIMTSKHNFMKKVNGIFGFLAQFSTR